MASSLWLWQPRHCWRCRSGRGSQSCWSSSVVFPASVLANSIRLMTVTSVPVSAVWCQACDDHSHADTLYSRTVAYQLNLEQMSAAVLSLLLTGITLGLMLVMWLLQVPGRLGLVGTSARDVMTMILHVPVACALGSCIWGCYVVL